MTYAVQANIRPGVPAKRPQMAAADLCEGFAWAKNGLRHSCISYRLAILHDTARVKKGNSFETKL